MSKVKKLHIFLVFGLFLVGPFATSSSARMGKVMPDGPQDPPAVVNQQAMQTAIEQCAFTTAEIQTFHDVELRDINIRLVETNNEPIGYEGGLTSLRLCGQANIQANR